MDNTFFLAGSFFPPLPFNIPLVCFPNTNYYCINGCYQYACNTQTIQGKENITESFQPQRRTRKQKQPSTTPQPSRFKYPKKNVESNVVNQVISYISTKGKSYKQVVKVLGSEQKANAYFTIMKEGKRQYSKYMGRGILQDLVQLERDHPIYIIYRKYKSEITLKFYQIPKVIRILINYFLKTMIVSTLLTSSKLDKSTTKDHLTRARQIYNFMAQPINPNSA